MFKRIWINLYIRRAGCHIEKLVSLLFRQWCPGAGHLSLGELSVTCSGILRASVVAVQELMSDSLQLHELEHTRLPCPSLSPGACSDSCPSSWWCYLAISSSVVLFSFAFNLFQHQGLFQWVSSSHQLAKVLEHSASVLPMNIQGWLLDIELYKLTLK